MQEYGIDGVDWGGMVEARLERRKAQIEHQRAEYRALYPEWDDAIGALIHERKVVEEQADEIERLKAKVKRLKSALKGALK